MNLSPEIKVIKEKIEELENLRKKTSQEIDYYYKTEEDLGSEIYELEKKQSEFRTRRIRLEEDLDFLNKDLNQHKTNLANLVLKSQ